VVYEAESGQRMWLMKAIREGAGELFNQFSGISERGLRWRPAEGEWCLKEVAAHMRDAELLYQKQIEAISEEHHPRLPHEALDVLPTERDYLSQDVYRLLNEYAHLRQETVWTLRMLDDDEWSSRGEHPYRGLISINDIVREMHEHDIEHLYQARRLHEAASRR
jgi:hypothetical protein